MGNIIKIVIFFLLLLVPAMLVASQVDSDCSIIGVSGFYVYNKDDPAAEINIFYSYWGGHSPDFFIKKYSLHVDNGLHFINRNSYYYKISYDAGFYLFQKTPVGFSIGGVHYSPGIKNPDIISGISLGLLYTPLIHTGVRYMLNQKSPVEFFAGFRFHFYSIDYNTGNWRRIL